MKKILDFLQRWFTGYYSIPVNQKFLAFPKLAPLFTVAFVITLIGDVYELEPVTICGYVLIVLSVFCFCLLKIFPNRKHNGLTRGN